MKKLFLTAALLCSFFNCGTANAEQPKAEDYRQWFSSGNFYVEFEYKKGSISGKNKKWATRILAAEKSEDENEIRMARMNYKYENSSLAWLIPLGAMFGDSENKNPEVMYKDGKYYQFFSKNKANVCAEDEINHENINPRDGWNKIPNKLALPDELAVLFWDDSPFSKRNLKIAAPLFVESSKEILDGKEYDCDCYETEINESAKLIYELFYDGAGDLRFAKSKLIRDEKEYSLNFIEIKEIRENIPENKKFTYENVQEYPVGMGDIKDLLESAEPSNESEVIRGEVL